MYLNQVERHLTPQDWKVVELCVQLVIARGFEGNAEISPSLSTIYERVWNFYDAESAGPTTAASGNDFDFAKKLEGILGIMNSNDKVKSRNENDYHFSVADRFCWSLKNDNENKFRTFLTEAVFFVASKGPGLTYVDSKLLCSKAGFTVPVRDAAPFPICALLKQFVGREGPLEQCVKGTESFWDKLWPKPQKLTATSAQSRRLLSSCNRNSPQESVPTEPEAVRRIVEKFLQQLQKVETIQFKLVPVALSIIC